MPGRVAVFTEFCLSCLIDSQKHRSYARLSFLGSSRKLLALAMTGERNCGASKSEICYTLCYKLWKNQKFPSTSSVRQALTEAIRRGDYKPGDRLPAERDLAKMHGVSYMTARRAVTKMVEVDLLSRRPRAGTFVPPRKLTRLATQTVHLVCPISGSSMIQLFLDYGERAAEKRQWRTEVIRLHPAQTRAAIRALDGGDLLIFLPSGPDDGPLAQALQRAEGHAVVLGNRLDQSGVPSVMADDKRGITLAMEHLQSYGHREIAVISAHPDHRVDRVQIAAWRDAAPADWNEDHFARRTIVIGTPRHQSRADHLYQTVSQYLSQDKGQTTALICLFEAMTLPTLAACRDANREAPEKMSLIAAGNNPMLAYAQPAVTCIDVNIEEHLERAMSMLENFSTHKPGESELLQLIEPHLVVRKSVQAPPK